MIKETERAELHKTIWRIANDLRGSVDGWDFKTYVLGMVVTAPRSPWQNAYVERIIGSIRRECLDHVIILDERHLRRVLSAYFDYHHQSRTHLSLGKDCPEPRPIHPSSAGTVVAFPQVGGLHNRYERRAA